MTEKDPQWHAQVIAATVLQKGICIFWSDVLGEKIAFIRDYRFQTVVPKDVVAYNEEELRELFAEGKPPLSPSSLKIIHEAKKEGGAVTSYGKQGDLFDGKKT